VHYLTLEQIKNAIRELGYVPRQRNVFYEYIDAEPEAVDVRAHGLRVTNV
jgi:cyclic dehypoxanthinyl futalosine synthase